MITIVAHMSIAARTRDEILREAETFVAQTRSEPGCIDFYLHESADDPTKFVWYENFRDQSAVDSHVGSAHVAGWFRLLDRLGASNAYEVYRRVGS